MISQKNKVSTIAIQWAEASQAEASAEVTYDFTKKAHHKAQWTSRKRELKAIEKEIKNCPELLAAWEADICMDFKKYMAGE